MPQIQTTKATIIASTQASVKMGIGPSDVAIIADNEGVAHNIHMAPDEAIQFAVALIQCATQAQILAEQQRIQVSMPGDMSGALKAAIAQR